MKTNKIVFYVATGLFTLLMLFSAGNYFFNYDMVTDIFNSLGYPTHLVYPLAIAKILGLAAIWFAPNQALREWAYAGFLFDILLAFYAHVVAGDGEQMGAVVAFVFWLLSYIYRKKAFA